LLLLLGHAPLLAAQQPVPAVRFTPIALSGQVAPGTDAAFVLCGTPVLNESGEVAFGAALSIDENGSYANWGIWGPTRGLSLGLVALEGSPAPGADANERFATFGAPYLGNRGRLGFVASLTDAAGGADPETHTGIWAQLDGGQPRLVARKGSPAPGTADGTTFGFLARPFLDGTERIAFAGRFASRSVSRSRPTGASGHPRRPVSTSSLAKGISQSACRGTPDTTIR
jgi:hypothetical protein